MVPLFSTNFGAYMAFPRDPGPDYSALDFDFESDPERLATMAAVYNSDDPNLSAFRDAGGKMIVWHGWADPAVTPYKTLDWYEKVAAKMGGEEETPKFVRLFMIPGMGHCGVVPGAGGIDQWSIDPLGALEKWVVEGIAPDSLSN